MEYEKIEHTFEPVYDEYSEILILGTFPSVKSRENNFYYGHPQNRFWKVIANINNVPVPESIDEKRKLLLDLHIAIWDVVASCSISGSSDSSIKDVTANDISKLLKDTNIKTIYGNGAKACELYNRYVYSKTGRAIVKLPSTSPANAGYSLERLCELWRKEVIAYLQRAAIPEEAPNVETIEAFSELENSGE
ncbi:MAG: DNA-deoxyinosine glycosylase [Lachnospira sp.]|mgnify:FL=1